jgi:hypothetical protein
MFTMSTLLMAADLFRFFYHVKMVFLAPVLTGESDTIDARFQSSIAVAPVTYARDWLFSIEVSNSESME